MRCERVKFLYEEYTQASLPVSSMTRLEEHLAACPSCREFYEQSDTIARLIRRSSEIAHPGPQYFEDLNARVLKSLDSPASRDASRDTAAILEIPSSQWR